MKEIVAYKTSDDRIFTNKADAEKVERDIQLKKSLEAGLRDYIGKYNGTCASDEELTDMIFYHIDDLVESVLLKYYVKKQHIKSELVPQRLQISSTGSIFLIPIDEDAK